MSNSTNGNDGLQNLGDQLDAAIANSSNATKPPSPAPTPSNVVLGSFQSAPKPAGGLPLPPVDPALLGLGPKSKPATEPVNEEAPKSAPTPKPVRRWEAMTMTLRWRGLAVIAVLALYLTVFLFNLSRPFEVTQNLKHDGWIGRRAVVATAEMFKDHQYATRFDWLGRKYCIIRVGDRVYWQAESGKPAIELVPKGE